MRERCDARCKPTGRGTGPFWLDVRGPVRHEGRHDLALCPWLVPKLVIVRIALRYTCFPFAQERESERENTMNTGELLQKKRKRTHRRARPHAQKPASHDSGRSQTIYAGRVPDCTRARTRTLGLGLGLGRGRRHRRGSRRRRCSRWRSRSCLRCTPQRQIRRSDHGR